MIGLLMLVFGFGALAVIVGVVEWRAPAAPPVLTTAHDCPDCVPPRPPAYIARIDARLDALELRRVEDDLRATWTRLAPYYDVEEMTR